MEVIQPQAKAIQNEVASPQGIKDPSTAAPVSPRSAQIEAEWQALLKDGKDGS